MIQIFLVKKKTKQNSLESCSACSGVAQQKNLDLTPFSNPFGPPKQVISERCVTKSIETFLHMRYPTEGQEFQVSHAFHRSNWFFPKKRVWQKSMHRGLAENARCSYMSRESCLPKHFRLDDWNIPKLLSKFIEKNYSFTWQLNQIQINW